MLALNAPRYRTHQTLTWPGCCGWSIATIYGEARLSHFEVWTYQVNPKEVGIGDPVDLSKRLDGVSKYSSQLILGHRRSTTTF